jgi:PAS domain S-box-containing protein
MMERIKKESSLRSYILQLVLVTFAIFLLVLYVFTFSRIHQQMGETGGIIILVPVVLSAWALGARSGMLAGLIVGFINFFLHGYALQHGSMEFVFIVFSGIIGIIIGWVTGRFSELRISSLLFGVNLSANATGHKVADLIRKRTKEMIARERNLLRTLIDNLPDQVYVKDNKGRYVINNMGHLRSIGLSKQEDALGKTSFDFFSELLARKFTSDEQNVLETGEALLNHEEEVLDAKTGKLNWHLTTKVPIRDNHGKIIGIVGVSSDITERKKIEEALKNEKAFLDALMDNIPDSIFFKDRQCRLLRMNRKEMQDLNVDDLSQIVGKTDADLWGEEFGRKTFTDEQRLMESGEPIIGLVESRKLEDGQTNWTWTTKVPLRDDNGQIVGLVGISRGINDLMKAQQEREKLLTNLSDSEHKFRTLFENLTEGVALHEMIYNENGKAVDYRILDINPSYEKYTGLLHKKAKGLLASVLYGTETPPYFEEFERVARTGESYTFETYFLPLERHFRIGVVSPKQGTFATVFEDITERRQKQKELQDKNTELERFTYTVSHDLKSPLITIKGFAGALLHDVVAGRYQRLESDLRRIADAADKMGGLLGNLLELSRIGRIMNPPSDVNLAELTQEVVGLLAGSITEHKVEVVIQPGLPTVYGDQRRLAQVLQNLIENAVKFMGNQPNPRIEIGTRKDLEEQVIYVQDNGIGVDPHYHETVFGLFNKLDTGTQGTGIGLALVRRIVEIHGGRVWVESQGKGFGTTFCFTLSSNHITRKEHEQ